MKKTLLSFMVCLGYIFTTAQVVQLVPPLNTNSIVANDSFTIVITNNDTVAVSFYPLTVFDSPGDYLFLDEDHYFDYLRSSGTQIGALRAHAQIVKSLRFFNGPLESDDYNGFVFNQSLCNKKYSTIGFLLGNSMHKCGNFSRSTTTSMIHAGIFSADSMREISIPGEHSLLEAFIAGDTALVDPDCGKSRWLDTLPNGTCMSATDLRDSGQYLYSQSPYVYCDPVPSIPCQELVLPKTDEYIGMFQNTIQYYSVASINPVQVSGKWKMCRGCSMSLDVKIPSHVVDTALLLKKQQRDSAMHYIFLGDPQTAMIFLGQFFDEPSSVELVRIFKDSDYAFSNGGAVDIPTSPFFKNANKIKLHVPAGNPVVIGTDLALPFSIKRIATAGPVAVGDTTFPSGVSNIAGYNEKNELDEFPDDTTVPEISAREFQYLQTGYIPANTSVDFVLYYNQLIYAIPNGLNIETFGNSLNGLTVMTYPAQITGLVDAGPDGHDAPIEYYTITFQKIDMPRTNGVYLKKQGSYWKKIIVQQ